MSQHLTSNTMVGFRNNALVYEASGSVMVPDLEVITENANRKMKLLKKLLKSMFEVS